MVLLHARIDASKIGAQSLPFYNISKGRYNFIIFQRRSVKRVKHNANQPNQI